MKKNIFKKKFLKMTWLRKNHVLIQFSPQDAQTLGLTINFKNHDCEENFFPKKLDFVWNFFSKKHGFHWRKSSEKH